MAERHSKKQLLDVVLSAVESSGWQTLLMSEKHPFRLRVHGAEDRGFDITVYIWNCTHGGGAARAADEYRIQLTGVVPELAEGATTLLLGWHDGYGVFVGFDIARHSGQASASPSIQVKEETLSHAHQNAFALHPRQNNEIAVAFRPEYFVDYALSSTALHQRGKAEKDLSLLNGLATLTEGQISAVGNTSRKKIVAQIARSYRAHDFRQRVLGAYGHACAFCGLQLNVVDAAHLVPVADDSSTDETSNGIALCKLHHAAYDQSLVSFDEHYRIEVSDNAVEKLRRADRSGGLDGFMKNLKAAIILPSDRRDYPDIRYVKGARRARNWATE